MRCHNDGSGVPQVRNNVVTSTGKRSPGQGWCILFFFCSNSEIYPTTPTTLGLQSRPASAGRHCRNWTRWERRRPKKDMHLQGSKECRRRKEVEKECGVGDGYFSCMRKDASERTQRNATAKSGFVRTVGPAHRTSILHRN